MKPRYLIGIAAVLVFGMIVASMSKKAQQGRNEQAHAKIAEKVKQEDAPPAALELPPNFGKPAPGTEAQMAANAAERERLQREYPQDWARMERSMGSRLNECLVTGVTPIPPSSLDPAAGKPGKSVLFNLRCGFNFAEWIAI